MRAVRGIHWWDADPSTMLMIYKSIIRFHLDYACFVLKPCNKKILNVLDRIRYKSLRLVTDIMKSTPINCLLAESGEISLVNRSG